MPNEATFKKNLVSSSPPSLVKWTRPASNTRVSPSRKCRAASAARVGIFNVRRKSPPVPLGSTPSSARAPARRMPFTTSLIVPSPPQATTSARPARAAILLAEFGDLRHTEVGDLLVGANRVAPFVELGEVERGAEAHAHRLAAAPVARDLMREVVA